MCEFEKRECRDKAGILVFGGTIEGRQVSDYLVSRRIPHTVCVATEYGEEVLTQQDYLTVHKGRMDMEEMCLFFQKGNFMAVVDATHPYAVEVSKNIRAACEREKMRYLRYLRAGDGNDAACPLFLEDSAGSGEGHLVRNGSGKAADEGHIWVNSTREAAKYLEKQEGVIFLTTGSKELSVFTEEISEKSRLFARVLPSAEVIASCRALGLEGKQICGMQGPFSQAMNEAMLHQTKASWLVTKNTGTSGGFSEKIQAAKTCGVRCVIIRRPEETGYGREELLKQLEKIIEAENGPGKAAGTEKNLKDSPGKATGTEKNLKDSSGKATGTEKNLKDSSGKATGTEKNLKDLSGKATGTENGPENLMEEAEITRNNLKFSPESDNASGKITIQITAKSDSMSENAPMTEAPGNYVSEKMENTLEITEEIRKSSEIQARRISCIGIGMGSLDTLTHEAAAEILGAEVIFGAKRILESAKEMWNVLQHTRNDKLHSQEDDAQGGDMQQTEKNQTHPVWVQEYEGKKIAAYLAKHPEYRRAAILMSGDVGFYSGARGIAAAFPAEEVRYFCGISSIVYFASKIPSAWQDAKLLSAHGKKINLLNNVRRYPKIIMLVSGAGDIEQFCLEMKEAGLENVRVTVGTNLSYPEETVSVGTPADFIHCGTTGLHIMMIENPDASYIVSPGVPDESFVRGKVPMTKEEVRILSIAKLRLSQDAVVYDVGAGTGSVAVECARLCTGGTVYAIEKNPEGIALIRENSRKMQVSNVVAVEGSAPEAMEDLPAPTHAFIGGSSGNMREILGTLRRKNPAVRVVINTIALESISEVMKLLPEIGAGNADIVQACIAKSRVLGRYHMMGALNPVYIISFGGTEQ